MITIWPLITIQGLYCYLDMGTNTVMYYKCSHVPNLISGNNSSFQLTTIDGYSTILSQTTHSVLQGNKIAQSHTHVVGEMLLRTLFVIMKLQLSDYYFSVMISVHRYLLKNEHTRSYRGVQHLIPLFLTSKLPWFV